MALQRNKTTRFFLSSSFLPLLLSFYPSTTHLPFLPPPSFFPFSPSFFLGSGLYDYDYMIIIYYVIIIGYNYQLLLDYLKSAELMSQSQSKDQLVATDSLAWRPPGRRILSYSEKSQLFCSIQFFNWLDQAHWHQEGQSTLLGLPI